MGFVHLLHVLLSMFIVYFGLMILVAVLTFFAALCIIYRVYKRFKSVGALILLALLIGMAAPRTVYAFPFHHNEEKQYAKQTEKIIRGYQDKLRQYETQDHPGVGATAVSLYEQQGNWDVELAYTHLYLYRAHFCPREKLDAFVRQLSRDIEATPPISPVEPPIVLPHDEGDTHLKL